MRQIASCFFLVGVFAIGVVSADAFCLSVCFLLIALLRRGASDLRPPVIPTVLELAIMVRF